jgi:aspartate aminotransferase-like enzyme
MTCFLVNLIYALHRSLTTIVAGSISVADRIKMHHEAAKRVRAAADELGLKRVALDDKCCANGMTAVRIVIRMFQPTLNILCSCTSRRGCLLPICE